MLEHSDYNRYDLKYDDLNRRLDCVKKEFGLRRAVSSKSLTGETRTFAEILDQEVEKIVLYFLRIQGELAHKAYQLREQQVVALQDITINLNVIESYFIKYRELGTEIMNLWN